MEKLTFGAGIISVIEKASGMNFEWFIVLILLLTVELILRAVPTKKRSSFIFRFLELIQQMVDFILPPDRSLKKD